MAGLIRRISPQVNKDEIFAKVWSSRLFINEYGPFPRIVFLIFPLLLVFNTNLFRHVDCCSFRPKLPLSLYTSRISSTPHSFLLIIFLYPQLCLTLDPQMDIQHAEMTHASRKKQTAVPL